MANNSRQNRPVRRTVRTSRRRNARPSEGLFARLRQPKYEFRPDVLGSSWLKRLYLTQTQRLNLLKWCLYALLCVGMLVLQDVILSRFQVLGATTDLAPAVILLISVLVGSEYGSIFVLFASTLYWFSGSAPGAYSIALLSFGALAVSLFRQAYWRRGLVSTVICAGVAMMFYEMSVFLAGVLLGLTQWGRAYRFAITGLMSWAVMLPLYPLCVKIGQIGGQPWKE